MSPPNGTWQQIIAQATASPDVLKQPEVMRNLQNILQTNVSVCQVNTPSAARAPLASPDLRAAALLLDPACSPFGPTPHTPPPPPLLRGCSCS